MSERDRLIGQPWRRPMTGRDPGEVHRQASFLELFFDHRAGLWHSVLVPASAAAILAATFVPWPVLLTGLVATSLVTVSVVLAALGKAAPEVHGR